jgi:hypothetical protein
VIEPGTGLTKTFAFTSSTLIFTTSLSGPWATVSPGATVVGEERFDPDHPSITERRRFHRCVGQSTNDYRSADGAFMPILKN